MGNKYSTKNLAKLAMLTAISCVLVLLIRIPYPPLPFLKYDPADIPIFITAFAFGPVAGLAVTVIVSVLQAFVLGDDGIYGCLMHILATGMFVIVAGNIYARHKDKKHAISAIIIGVVALTLTMCIANYFVTPIFTGMPTEAVAKMILPFIVPFNLLKGGINGFITFLVYKRISGFLHKDRL